MTKMDRNKLVNKENIGMSVVSFSSATVQWCGLGFWFSHCFLFYFVRFILMCHVVWLPVLSLVFPALWLSRSVSLVPDYPPVCLVYMISSSVCLFPLFSLLTCVQLFTTPCVLKSLSSHSLFVSWSVMFSHFSPCVPHVPCVPCVPVCVQNASSVRFSVSLPAPRVFCHLPFLFLASLDFYFSFMWKRKEACFLFLFCCLPASMPCFWVPFCGFDLSDGWSAGHQVP